MLHFWGTLNLNIMWDVYICRAQPGNVCPWKESPAFLSWLFFASICSLHQSLPEHTIPLDIRMRNGQSVEFLITHEKSICIINPLLLLRALQLSPLVHRAELNTIQCSNRRSREWDAPYIKWAWNAAILREALRWWWWWKLGVAKCWYAQQPILEMKISYLAILEFFCIVQILWGSQTLPDWPTWSVNLFLI